MKKCIECGYGGIFAGDLCDPCRRKSKYKVDTKGVTQDNKDTKFVTPGPGEVCPCCGRKMPMTAAQRKRKQRAKQRGGE